MQSVKAPFSTSPGCSPFRYKQQPEQSPHACCLNEATRSICLLVLHPNSLRQRSCLSQVKPSRILPVQAKAAAKEEVGGDDGVDRRVFNIVMVPPPPQSIIQ